MTDEQLKPCPFCGGEGSLQDADGGLRATCVDCWFSVTPKTWNTRTLCTAADMKAAVEAEREACAKVATYYPADFEYSHERVHTSVCIATAIRARNGEG